MPLPVTCESGFSDAWHALVAVKGNHLEPNYLEHAMVRVAEAQAMLVYLKERNPRALPILIEDM